MQWSYRPALPCMAGGCLRAGRGPHMCGPYMAAMVLWNISARKKGMYDLSNRTCLFILYSFPQQEQHGQQHT